MVLRLILFFVIAIIGLGCFVTAIVYVPRGPIAEWVTLVLAPISGICLAILAKMVEVPLSFRPFRYFLNLKTYINRLKIFNQ